MFRKQAGWMFIAAALLSLPAAGADTFYVDAGTCPDEGDGSEGHPFCRIQRAIDLATDGDTILVLPGTYRENLDFLGKDITVRSADGPEATVIDAGFNSSAVIFHTGEGRDAVLEGFTLTNGTGFSNNSLDVGGAISINSASPTIRGNIITNNEAAFGGGIDTERGNPLIENNIITGNIAFDQHLLLHISGDGGAISIFNSSAVLIGNRIYANTAHHNGGGIWSDEAPNDPFTLMFRNNLIYRNEALGRDGFGGLTGGIHIEGNPEVTISGCTITRNIAPYTVDGVMLSGEGRLVAAIENSIIYGNSANPGQGREVYLRRGTLDVRYCDVEGAQTGVTNNNGTLNWGAGNLDADPGFADPEADDYHLDDCSPLVDAGDPAFTPLSGETDVDGDDRVIFAAIDIGADEVATACGGDCAGSERISATRCRQKNGVNKLVVKLAGGVPGDTFVVRLSGGERQSGTVRDTGKGKAKFRGAPSGAGDATATWGCGATDTKGYDCP
ncbi:MAG: hypothetical protein FLDDKLPJ_00821 [Phycisphaerae bacterium]|nr:hypothetical protein [Phycisphaerae bacterium]